MAVTEYTWNPLTDSVIEESDGAGNVLVEYTNEPTPYGPLVSERRDSETRQYHFDALGSTRALTDDSENVTDTFAYDAWGSLTVVDASSQSLLWVGRFGYHWHKSAGEGLSIVRSRLYSPILAAWTSVDPLITSTHEAYQYARRAPVLDTDPSGLRVCVPTSSGINTILGLGTFDGVLTMLDSRPWYPINSVFALNFNPGDYLPYFGDPFRCPGCCCDSLKFIQVVREKSRVFDIEWDSGWEVDLAGNPSNFPWYPHLTSVGNPCATSGRSTKMVDEPGGKGRWTVDYLWQRFESCIACASGVKGPSMSEDGALSLTVYGCITWEHMAQYFSFGRKWIKVNNRLQTNSQPPYNSTLFIPFSNEPPKAPTADFIDAVINQRMT